ncbi:TonB-dependent receptor [Pseudoduganella sp. OTU4001]|uniref:TonB-dependent receptor n=1 Tax=Pseudoduganella sp. OTU4001 TaxID=3043854 RepID=UPI00313ACC5A
MMKLSKMHVLVTLAVVQMAAQAQEANQAAAGQLEVVTVTAQRRAENIREVPVSVSMINNEKLDILLSGGQDIRVLAGKTPSLNVESSTGRVFPRFYIRGYGNADFAVFASQPVSLIYDDVVQENPILKGYPMYDLANVEVLRGPQGTLFGRNTPAGVVKFESAKPNLRGVEGFYNVSYASDATANIEAAANVPLSKEWALRVSTLRQHRDDFVDNTFTGEKNALEGYNEHAERVQVLYQPNGVFNALFNVHRRATTGSSRLFRANIIKKGSNTFVDGFDPEKIAINGREDQELKTQGANLRMSWDLGAHKLYSVTGYETVAKYNSAGDIDGGNPTNAPAVPFQVATAAFVPDIKQYSQEFRVESKYTGPLNWQAGAYFFDEKAVAGQDNFNVAGTRTSRVKSQQKNEAYALFGSVNYAVNDAFTVRGGLRYTDDKKDFEVLEPTGTVLVGPKTANLSKDKFNWDLSGTYKLNNDVSVYARYATGFRAPSIAAPSTAVPITVADAETITSIEAGVKADLWNRRARASLSVYDYDVKNQQLTVVGGNSNVTKLINAAKTKGRGVEGEIEGFVTNDFKVSASASYNFTEIRDPALSVNKCAQCTVLDPINAAGRVVINGNDLPQAPKWIINLNARYNYPLADGNLFVLTDWSYRSKVNFFLYEAVEFTGAPLTEGGLRVGYNWDGGKYEVAVFGRNVADQRRITGAIDFNNLTGFINEPRQFGVQFKGSF